MPRRSGVLFISALLALLGFPEVQADATPGSYHTAVGSGVDGEPGACTGSFICRPDASGDPFSIDASDRAGAYGWMQLNGVRISLDCVVIRHWDGRTVDGHELYASGTGTDGKRYFTNVTATYAGGGSFLVSTSPGTHECAVSKNYVVAGHGSFVITAL